MSQNRVAASFTAFLSESLFNANVTQSWVSKRSGIPQAMISKISSGRWKNGTLETVNKLASALGFMANLEFIEIGTRNTKTANCPHSPACFWDVEPKSVHLPEHAFFVTERIMNYGGKKEIRWLLKNVSSRIFQNVLLESRNLTPKSAQFWALLLDVPLEKVRCLKTR